MTQVKKLRYTLGFIHCPETKSVLLLNRQKAPWMGRWNGVGGKLDENESPLECIIRETKEETGLDIPQYISRGVMTWMVDGEDRNGVYLFTGRIKKEEFDSIKSPFKFCYEGILDWKTLDWILDEENTGIVDNIQKMFKSLFLANEKCLYVATYENKALVNFTYTPNGNQQYNVF